MKNRHILWNGRIIKITTMPTKEAKELPVDDLVCSNCNTMMTLYWVMIDKCEECGHSWEDGLWINQYEAAGIDPPDVGDWSTTFGMFAQD